ncbi:MAG: hypothetical protein KJ971_04245 [Firmicutes bacterium]|nr:hypothetical protein [Bacillota bacterium]
MRFITKKTVLLSLGIILLVGTIVGIILITVNGNNTTTTADTTVTGIMPTLSNPDAVFFSGDTYDVTYSDIYEEFKINDGINQLLFMVDTVLLSDYLDQVTQSEIDSKIKYLTYGTINDDEIADIEPQDKLDYEKNYDENMYLLGYSGNENTYVRMVVAKENYAIEAMTSEANSSETWYVGPSTVATSYTNGYYEDLSSIKIRFLSETDAKNVLKVFNLVSIGGTLKLYIGDKPIDEVPSSSFTDINTRELSEAELVDAFIDMYNYVYEDYRLPLSKAATLSELDAIEDLQMDYTDLASSNTSLATFMYRTLGSINAYSLDETSPLYYTYAPVKYYGESDTSCYMILNLSRTIKEDLSDFSGDEAALKGIIGASTYDEIYQDKIDTSILTSGFVSSRVTDLRALNNLVIYDYYLGIDYQAVDVDYITNKAGHLTQVASFGDEYTITADELLTFALNKNAALYALYAAQVAVVMDAYFSEVYCTDTSVVCNYDLSENESAKVVEHRATLEELRTSFEESYYVYYYTFDEYIYLAYGAKTETEMIEKYYVKSTLQPYLIYDELQKDDWWLLTDYLYDLIQDYYDNYFSLNVEHLLIFVDRDENGSPDDYQEFLLGLTDQVAYDALLSDFHDTIQTYLDASEDNTFASLISTYNKAKRTDPIWGIFKSYGFNLLTENLSASESLNYLNSVDTYETPFVDGLISAYNTYNLTENKTKTFMYVDDLIQTTYGVHLLYVQKGTDFVKPSAKFTMTYDTEGLPNYTAGTDNTENVPSIEQLKVYSEYRFYEIIYGTSTDLEETYGITVPRIPVAVTNAMEAYFTTLHDSMYVVGYLNIIVADKLMAGTFLNQDTTYCNVTDANLKTYIAEIKDIYFNQVFQNLDTISE